MNEDNEFVVLPSAVFDRWLAFDREERAAIHHALRMYGKYPGLTRQEYEPYRLLADQAWAAVCREAERALA